ncbi:MAG: glutamate--tRNA ligase family protein [Gemmatimonadaceae bacterium]
MLRTKECLSLAASLRDQALKPGWRTRFAPAPTGFLHLGHVVNALHVWGIARAYDGRVLLRIEDHDQLRCRKEFEYALLDDLDWLGLVPDVGTTEQFRGGTQLQRQSDNRGRYEAVMQNLSLRDLEYGCICTRKDIAEITGDVFGKESRYPGTCSHVQPPHITAMARRFRVSDQAETFNDIRLGVQSQQPSEQCGDFLLRDRNGNFTYQYCVSVDDWDQQIDVVIRGEDLLSSTGRQMQLARAIGRVDSPLFLHHALLYRDDGLKLSKSLGDTGIRELRDAGASPQDVLGRAAFAAGLISEFTPISPANIADLFS